MNELSQYLVNQILLEDTELHNFVVVYSGRFQPFHKGHYATYQNLCKKFGKDKVFIGTSNKTDNRQSPFNFKEKKIIMTKMFGIQSNKIVEIKNPYAPTEILKNFDETTTGYISVVGEKDELDENGNIRPQGVDYSLLTPVLVKAIQELKSQNDALQSRIETLESK